MLGLAADFTAPTFGTPLDICRKLAMVLAFWFGSNSNSQRKTELLALAQPVK